MSIFKQTETMRAADWANIVNDPNERNILETLSDQRFDFRTVHGIVHDTGLDESFVTNFLSHSDFVRMSYAPGPGGSQLYTLSTRPVKTREALAATAIATKSFT